MSDTSKSFNCLLFFAIVALPAMAAPLRIAFPGAGADDLMQPEAKVRVSQSLFLSGLLKSEADFRLVSEDRATAIFTAIKTGAMVYGTDNLTEIFKTYGLDVDVVCDYRPKGAQAWSATGVELEVWTKTGVERGAVDKYSMYDASDKLIDLLARACKLDADRAAKFHAYLKDRSRIYEAIYVVPRLRGHYCDNTGETQFKSLLEFLSAKNMDLRVNARICEAAWWAYADGRGVGDGSHDPNWTMAKVNKLGLAGVNSVIGTEEEDSMRNYVADKRSPQSIPDTLYGYAKILAEDAVSRSMTEAIEKSEDESEDLDLDKEEKSEEKESAKKEAQARGGLKGLAWRKDAKGLALTLKCAKQTEPITRRTVAYCLGEYRQPEKTGAALKTIAAAKDEIAAVYAVRSLLDNQLPAPDGAAVARKVIDGKMSKAGVIGFDPIQIALSVLADVGDKSDRARFAAYVADPKVARRREAVRGIFAKCEPTNDDLALLNDTDSSVVVAGFHEFTSDQVRSKAKFADVTRAYANDPCEPVANAARVVMEPLRPTSGPALVQYRLAFGNPYERRCILDDCAAKKDADGVAVGCANADAHIRAYAVKLLATFDKKRARAEAMKLLSDPHTFARFYATFVLADTAEKGDAAALEKSLAKEQNRVVKLYLADAIALATGKPKPAPLPKVNSMRETGNAVMWQCGVNEPFADKKLYDGYYVLSHPLPNPPERVRKAHDERKASVFPRPTPIGNPGLIISHSASMDKFWTELDRQLPPGSIEYVDGLVYGEETMGYDPGALWPKLWSTFCEKAKINPDAIRGDMKKLTPNQKLMWDDWSCRVMVRAANEMIDFTRDYIGKLRPGIETCTYDGRGCFGATDAYKDLKFDIYGIYAYDGDNRCFYEYVRGLKSVFPDKPVQWYSFGNIEIGQLGNSCYGKPVTWNTRMPTHVITHRFDHCYADSMLVLLGGADMGYFTCYGAESWDGKAKVPFIQLGDIYHGSPVLEKVADAAVANSYVMFKDVMKKAKRDKSEDIDAPSDDETEDLQLEEEGSKDDPIQKQVDAQREAVRRGLLFMARATHDTTPVELGIKRQFPGYYESFLLGGQGSWGRELCYTPAGMLLPNFDKFQTAKQPIDGPGLDHYKLAIVEGVKQRMDEATRVKWIEWMSRKPVVLVVQNGLFSTGVDWPYVDIARPEGDLKTFWPWEKDISLTKPAKPGDPVRYQLTAGVRGAKVLEQDKFGPTRVAWRKSGFKGLVIFDMTKGRAATASIRKLIATYFGKQKVDFELNEHPGRIHGRIGTLQVEHLSWSSYTTNTASRGFELLTGKYNPVVTPQFNCAVTTDEYEGPCLAIHGGVYVLAHDARLKVVEKLPNGVKVEVQGLCHAVTKTGKLPKIVGKDLKEIKTDPNLWYIDGVDEEGVCTLPPHGDVECFSRGGEVDDMPPWRVFRVQKPTVLTITAE